MTRLLSIRFTLVALIVALLVGAAQAGPDDKAKTGLNVGDTAPEIKGKDVKGKAMKLSDFRGKVVVLDFFGDW